MDSIEKISEGVRLLKEGCSEAPIRICNRNDCPLGWLCHTEEIAPPEYWYIPTPHD